MTKDRARVIAVRLWNSRNCPDEKGAKKRFATAIKKYANQRLEEAAKIAELHVLAPHEEFVGQSYRNDQMEYTAKLIRSLKEDVK